MGTPIDRPGTFRGRITEYGLVEASSDGNSRSQGVSIKAVLTAAWNQENQDWDDWSEYDVEAAGVVNIVRRDGTVNQGGVESLIKYAGWNGNLESLIDDSWQPTDCQFTIKEEGPNDYHKETVYRLAFVNDFNRVPGQVGNVTAERAKELQNQYGAQFRALAGNAVRNAVAAPQGKPKMPSTRKRPPVQPIKRDANLDRDIDAANAELDKDAKDQGDDIPFNPGQQRGR